MMTKTEMLDEFVIDCPDPAAMTATQLKAKVVHLFRCEAGDDFNPIMLSVRRAYFGPRWNTISLFVAITARVSEGISRRNRWILVFIGMSYASKGVSQRSMFAVDVEGRILQRDVAHVDR